MKNWIDGLLDEGINEIQAPGCSLIQESIYPFIRRNKELR
jgi:hypothetical protein